MEVYLVNIQIWEIRDPLFLSPLMVCRHDWKSKFRNPNKIIAPGPFRSYIMSGYRRRRILWIMHLRCVIPQFFCLQLLRGMNVRAVPIYSFASLWVWICLTVTPISAILWNRAEPWGFNLPASIKCYILVGLFNLFHIIITLFDMLWIRNEMQFHCSFFPLTLGWCLF